MRRWAVALLVVGCASQSAQVRFAVGHMEPSGAPADRTAEVETAARVAETVRAHELEVVDCFDDLAARRDLAKAIHVGVDVQLRGGALTVLGVAPLDAASVSDAALVACLADQFARWRVAGADADLRIPIAIAPKVSSDYAHAQQAAQAPPHYRAEE